MSILYPLQACLEHSIVQNYYLPLQQEISRLEHNVQNGGEALSALSTSLCKAITYLAITNLNFCAEENPKDLVVLLGKLTKKLFSKLKISILTPSYKVYIEPKKQTPEKTILIAQTIFEKMHKISPDESTLKAMVNGIEFHKSVFFADLIRDILLKANMDKAFKIEEFGMDLPIPCTILKVESCAPKHLKENAKVAINEAFKVYNAIDNLRYAAQTNASNDTELPFIEITPGIQ